MAGFLSYWAMGLFYILACLMESTGEPGQGSLELVAPSQANRFVSAKPHWQAPQSFLPGNIVFLVQTEDLGEAIVGATQTWLSFMNTSTLERQGQHPRPLEPYYIRHFFFETPTEVADPINHHWLLSLKNSFQSTAASHGPNNALTKAIDQLIPVNPDGEYDNNADPVVDQIAERFPGPGFVAAAGQGKWQTLYFGFTYDPQSYDWNSQLQACSETQEGERREFENVTLRSLPLDGFSFYAWNNVIYGIGSTNLDQLQVLLKRQLEGKQTPLPDSLSQQRRFQRAIAVARERDFSGQISFFAADPPYQLSKEFWRNIPTVCGELRFNPEEKKIDYLSEWLLTKPTSYGVLEMQHQLKRQKLPEEIYLPSGIAFIETTHPKVARHVPAPLEIWYPMKWAEAAQNGHSKNRLPSLIGEFDDLPVGHFIGQSLAVVEKEEILLSLEGFLFPSANRDEVLEALEQALLSNPSRFLEIEKQLYRSYSRMSWQNKPQLLPNASDSQQQNDAGPLAKEPPSRLTRFADVRVVETELLLIGAIEPAWLLVDFQDSIYLLPNIVAGLSGKRQRQVLHSIFALNSEASFWKPIKVNRRDNSVATGLLQNTPICAVDDVEPVLYFVQSWLRDSKFNDSDPPWTQPSHSPLFVLAGLATNTLCGLDNWVGMEEAKHAELVHQRDLIQTEPYFRFHDTVWQPEWESKK